MSQRMKSMPSGTRRDPMAETDHEARSRSEHCLNGGDHAARHFGHGTVAIHRDEATVLIEPFEERARLVLEDFEARADHFGVVVGAPREHRAAVVAQRASLVAAHRPSALGAHEPGAEPFGGLTLGHHQLHHGVEVVGREKRVERDGLIDRAREPVEYEAVALRRPASGVAPPTTRGPRRRARVGPTRRTSCARRPTGEPSSISARSSSPVEMWGTPSTWASRALWVPLPDPGRPSTATRTGRLTTISPPRVGRPLDCDHARDYPGAPAANRPVLGAWRALLRAGRLRRARCGRGRGVSPERSASPGDRTWAARARRARRRHP